MTQKPCLTVNLQALRHNWSLLNKQASNAECAAVIKANAYGLGAIPVLQALLAEGCKTFFVASLDEAIELREAVPGNYQLIVLGGQAAAFPDECRRYDLSPTLISPQQICNWLSKSVIEVNPVLKIDSGMHRLGVSVQEFAELYNQDSSWIKRLRPGLVMSHLACADSPEHPLNRKQLSISEEVRAKIRVESAGARFSLANSSGIFLGESYHFDLVRPGVSLYGGNPLPDSDNPMSAVVSLSLPVMQIKHLAPGDSVGYGADFRVEKITRIGTVFAGYADGLLRSLGNRGYAYCHGTKVPIAGRVSMDAISFDLSGLPLPDENIRQIEILCENQQVDDLAKAAGTISYEILTSLGTRYQRFYKD